MIAGDAVSPHRLRTHDVWFLRFFFAFVALIQPLATTPFVMSGDLGAIIPAFV
ncbi:MAG: hypothetical protein M3O86_04240 [Actinomycetota bacterium]|nr:hypothetical protein [Actinomycetota bacterium]